MSRCTGHCCRVFTVPLSPEGLAENLRAFEAGEEEDRNGKVVVQDIETIAPMVMHIGLFKVGDAHPFLDGHAMTAAGHFYSCSNLTEEGDCTIYEDRPMMCRTYPHGRPCEYPGCTWESARLGWVDHNGMAYTKAQA